MREREGGREYTTQSTALTKSSPFASSSRAFVAKLMGSINMATTSAWKRNNNYAEFVDYT